VARIGEANVPYPPGTVNRYVITSKQTGTITQVEGEPEAQWYWNVVGAGWQMPMYQATVTADFPVAPTGVGCLVGTGDLEQPCEVSEQSDKRYVTQLQQLDPMTPVTWKAMMPAGGLTVVELSEPWYNNAIPAGVGVLLALGMVGLIRIAHDPKPSQAPVFAAPGDDILAYAWTLKERPPDDVFQALLLQLRHLGTLQISLDPATTPRRKPKFVTLQRTDRALPDGVIGSGELLDTLGLNTPGSQQDIKQKSVSMGRKINALQAELRTASTGQARAYRWYDYSALGRLTVLLAALLPAFAGVTLVASESVWLATLFFIPGIAGLWATADLKTRLTAEGRRVRDQIAPCERSTSSSFCRGQLLWAVPINGQRPASHHRGWIPIRPARCTATTRSITPVSQSPKQSVRYRKVQFRPTVLRSRHPVVVAVVASPAVAAVAAAVAVPGSCRLDSIG